MDETQNIESLVNRVAHLEQVLNKILFSDKFLFQKPLIGGPNGLRLGSNINDKIGFYASAPIVQWSSGTARQDIHDNSGATMQIGTRFTGNVGSTYYGFGDVVAALKTYGLLN